MTYGPQDIRFTTKGQTLYAIALGWPENGKMVIKSLAKTADPAQNKIRKVELLGRSGKLKFDQTADGLVLEIPGPKLSDLSCALRITGTNLKPALLSPAAAPAR
jgi:alpha-L-fucosidase